MAKTARVRSAGLVVLVLFGLSRQAAADQPLAALILHATDQAGLPAAVLDGAKQVVAAIYRKAGVEVVWDDAMDAEAAKTGSARRLYLIIVPATMATRMAVNESALGVAVTSSKSRGKLAYVFYNRVEDVAARANIDVALILGHVMAHESGHMLLTPGHAPVGLMRADWNTDDMHDAVKSRLLFSDAQAAQIRTRLGGF